MKYLKEGLRKRLTAYTKRPTGKADVFYTYKIYDTIYIIYTIYNTIMQYTI